MRRVVFAVYYRGFIENVSRTLICAAVVFFGAGVPISFAGDGVVSYLPPAFETQAQGPIGLFLHGDRIYVPDPIDDEIIVFDREGAQTGVLDSPDGFDFDDALAEGSKLLLFDKSGAGRSVDLGATTRSASRSLDANELTTVTGTYSQRLIGQLEKDAEGLAGVAGNTGRSLDQNKLDIGQFLKSALPDRKIDAAELVETTKDKKVVATWLEPKDGSFRTYVAIFAADGELEGSARLPQDPDFVPGIELAVDDSGVVYALLRTPEGPNAFVPRKVEFSNSRSIERANESSGDKAMSDEVDQTSTAAELEKLGAEFDSFVRALEPGIRAPEPQESRKALPGIRRADARKRMYAFINHQWTLKARNYSRSGISENCKPDEYWRRPPRLDDKREKEVIGIPYRWGGYFRNLSSFNKRLDQGYLAGDVCTCRKSSLGYCIVKHARGLDCSGAVSSAWLAPYHGTSRMKEITNRIAWKDLKEADALNKAGSHIMLFVEYVGFGGSHARIAHSSLGCGGVCEKIYPVKKLKAQGYKPIRYKAIKK